MRSSIIFIQICFLRFFGFFYYLFSFSLEWSTVCVFRMTSGHIYRHYCVIWFHASHWRRYCVHSCHSLIQNKRYPSRRYDVYRHWKYWFLDLRQLPFFFSFITYLKSEKQLLGKKWTFSPRKFLFYAGCFILGLRWSGALHSKIFRPSNDDHQ